MSERTTYKLADASIAQIAKLLQVGILTGTDVSDNIRTLRLVVDEGDGKLHPDPELLQEFDRNIEHMLKIADAANG